ncbi:NAD-dependent epimerase/dehydratase family protein [bacterium]|nr:NAD-dependent epimerase/dehydratase family protein [bacterium]
MHILVTGGAGFIGSHICDALIANGHTVSVVDNLSTGTMDNLPDGVSFHKLDIRDSGVEALWAKERFDLMIHTAAQMDVRKSVEDPVYDADVNLKGTLQLLEAGRKNGLKKVVFLSSGGAGYDDSVPFPTPESVPMRPVSPYGIAKATTELHLRFYHIEYDIQYIALRLGNIYGPRQNPHGEAGVIAIFCNRLLQDQSVTIHGDGMQTRDYVYVGDVVRAVEAAMKTDFNGSLNIGTSVETNVVDLYQALRDASRIDKDPVHGPAKPGEVRRSCLDVSQAEAILGWKAQVPFHEGVKRTWEFFQNKR